MRARVKWTIAIVALLVGNAVAMGVLAVVARAGQSQVIPDYYEKAASYDDAIDEATRSAALGWHVRVAIVGDRLDVLAHDGKGETLRDATVQVTGYSRAHAALPLDLTLDATALGCYSGTLPTSSLGLYDLRVVIERGEDRYAASFTVEANVFDQVDGHW